METCKGPKCVNEAMIKGLCDSHYQQLRRTGRLTPLRRRSGDRTRLSGVRLSKKALERLEEMAGRQGKPLATLASELLEAWATRTIVVDERQLLAAQ